MLLIGNGKVITRDSANPYLENGAVVTDGENIKEVGTLDAMKQKYPEAEFVDAHGGVIMPGLINAHTHIYSGLARGLSIVGNNPTNFLEVLEGTWWAIDRQLDLDGTRACAWATVLDCIRDGVTTIFDHHASFGAIEGSLFKIAEASEKMGVRSCLCYEVSDRDGEEKAKASVKENADFIKYAAQQNNDMIKAMMGMHAQFTISDKTFEMCRENMPEGVGAHIHVAEGIEDLHDCLHKYGKRIVNRLMDHDLLGPQTMTAHCIYVNEQEMDLLKATDTMVVHNPESNMGNACGCPPTMELVHKGIVTGLGTDGYTHDMLESWKVANILHKHHLCDPNAAWGEVPKMLFENNAIIANRYFKKPLGVLKEGAAADVIVMDYNPLTPMRADNVNGHLLFGTTGHDVVTTVCNGKVLMKDREVLVCDVDKVMADCRQSAKELADDINGGK